MRIQHNISAMNSYRNFSTNNSNLSKNLEKLSTGYKINRAGDDAAGLAISEKMRAQITGLEGATKNAKDGISLIQTAEGALTEVHSMLNRMTTLAEQSANGTYSDDLDREQLQKEVDSLKSEIDRIADSTNFNGLKLLDGSLAMKSGASSVKSAFDNNGTFTNINTSVTGATYSQTLTINDTNLGSLKNGDKVGLSFTMLGADGKATEYKVEVTMGSTATKAEATKLLGDELKKQFGNDYPLTVNSSAGTIQFKNASGHRTEETNIVNTSVKMFVNDIEKKQAGSVDTRTTGAADKFEIDFSSHDSAKKNRIEIDGVSYQILTRGQKADDGNKAIFIDQSSQNFNKDSVKQIVSQLQSYGVDASVKAGAETTISLDKTNVISDKGKGGLSLQIGDTAEKFNKLTVSVDDMHTEALGIGTVDISNQDGAAAALDKIKTAINNVSDTRGSLGALQNRLDHTINNLGVMRENIQNAESTIRDTDVAEEMMTYTKNNILNQSAQAMLAQANQLPQGVLQLLQG